MGEGWSTGSLLDGFFDIQQRVGTPEVIAVQFAKPDAIFADDPSPVPIASAPEATDILQANPGLAGVETSESRIGGLTGRQVTVDNTSGDAAQVMRVPPGPLSILDGRRLWIALLRHARWHPRDHDRRLDRGMGCCPTKPPSPCWNRFEVAP